MWLDNHPINSWWEKKSSLALHYYYYFSCSRSCIATSDFKEQLSCYTVQMKIAIDLKVCFFWGCFYLNLTIDHCSCVLILSLSRWIKVLSTLELPLTYCEISIMHLDWSDMFVFGLLVCPNIPSRWEIMTDMGQKDRAWYLVHNIYKYVCCVRKCNSW